MESTKLESLRQRSIYFMPDLNLSATSQNFSKAFPAATWSEFRNQVRCVIPSENFAEAIQWLKAQGGFDLLVDITCVDYLQSREAEHRFGLAYSLTSVERNERLIVRVYLDEPNLKVRSVVDLWAGASWMEREVWDMFGVVFEGHPDLRRILLPEEFTAHPLRKDYPLQGKGERHNFPVLHRSDA